MLFILLYSLMIFEERVLLFTLWYSLIISEDQFLVLKRECMSCLIVLLTRYFLWEDGPGLEKGGGGGGGGETPGEMSS